MAERPCRPSTQYRYEHYDPFPRGIGLKRAKWPMTSQVGRSPFSQSLARPHLHTDSVAVSCHQLGEPGSLYLSGYPRPAW